jgi:hypothetical protein
MQQDGDRLILSLYKKYRLSKEYRYEYLGKCGDLIYCIKQSRKRKSTDISRFWEGIVKYF